MKIVQAPHAALRERAKPVKRVDKKLFAFAQELRQTLADRTNPQGVGLAAPQVAKSWRMFCVQYNPPDSEEQNLNGIEIVLNPSIVAHSQETTFGPDENSPTIEGCLSIPKLYGPVPRWKWIEVEYQVLDPNQDALLEVKKRLAWFPARVFQHELDHLDGKLFTDYSLEHELPLFTENHRGKLEEIADYRAIELF